jgi:hypothetical protein
VPEVQQDYTEEATVLVWRNLTKLKFIPTAHFGHVAIMLRGPSLHLLDSEYRYVSWWPGEGAGKKDAMRSQDGVAEHTYEGDMIDELSESARRGLQRGTFQPRPGQEQVRRGRDLEWGVNADALVAVLGLDAANRRLGVNLNAMWTWYEGYQQNGDGYQLASRKQSCSGVALVALIEGGGEAFCSAPLIKLYAEPKQVERYARDLKRTLTDFNLRFINFRDSNATYISNQLRARKMFGATAIAAQADLWDYQTWHQQSEVKGSMRGLLIQRIDSALKDYHKYSWGHQFKKKYQHFIAILDAVMTHRQTKPDSERGFAVARLGKQACDVLISGAIH